MIVQRFLHWLERAPSSSRADAAAALARASLLPEMADEERAAAHAALTLLLDDPSHKVRLAMADAIASHADAPRHLIMALADDHSDIAMLILCRSPLFLDSELLEVVANEDPVTMLAIACRQPLSNNVAAAIIDTNNSVACLALLKNTAFQLSGNNLRTIANKMGDRAEIREALMKLPFLPADVRQSMISRLSRALKQFVVDKRWLNEKRASRAIREAKYRATTLLACNINDNELPVLVEHLRATSQLTAAFLLRAVCTGNIPLFTASIANLARMPENRIVAVLQQGRTAAFRAIYDRCNLPISAIPAITAAVDLWREEWVGDIAQIDAQQQKRVVEQILVQYLGATDNPDSGLVALLRRIFAEVSRDAALQHAREISAAA